MTEISIHALLAESDAKRLGNALEHLHFYPRSPCGERLEQSSSYNAYLEISIHALLAESDANGCTTVPDFRYFYPRSPCGERRGCAQYCIRARVISIHALLAESDVRGEHHANSQQEFLSTLSLRRATP